MAKIIFIDKIISRVVRRIYVNHLDFAQVVLTKKFQHLQIVSLYVEIFGVIEINALFPARTKCHRGRRICKTYGFLFVRPSELITFLGTLNNIFREFLTENVKIYTLMKMSILANLFSEAVREELSDFLNVAICDIHSVHFHFIHKGCVYFQK